MKFVLTIGLILISLPAITIAQRPAQRNALLTRVEIREAERRLYDLGYWTGAIDGVFDAGSQSALLAFQKWERRPITGQLTLDELEAIRTSTSPQARDLGYGHAEVDLDRQVLLLVSEEGRVRVLPISSGNNKPFMDEGQESISYTPRGRFVVYDKEIGWQTGALGATYYANFISGGVAIHGSRNVPSTPASHGCIRVPMFAARELSKLLKLGTIVLVYDQLSFVSAKDWALNPKLKQAGLSISAALDYPDEVRRPTTRPRSRAVAIKKARSRITRAD